MNCRNCRKARSAISILENPHRGEQRQNRQNTVQWGFVSFVSPSGRISDFNEGTPPCRAVVNASASNRGSNST